MSGLTAEAIDRIQVLTEAREKTIEIDGKPFSRFTYKPVFNDPRPSPLEFSTLGGLADYVNKNIDDVKEDQCIIVIDDYDQVSLYSPVRGEKKDRHLIARAKVKGTDEFPFGKFIGQEEFIIGLSSLFCNVEDKEKVLVCSSSLTIKVDVQGEDKGTSTSKAAAHEVVTNGKKVGPVVTLSPYRTFRELDQPLSSFIFRFKDLGGAPGCALFEADGGAWRIEAKERINNYLKTRLTFTPILC
jgi:hypothetical protein